MNDRNPNVCALCGCAWRWPSANALVLYSSLYCFLLFGMNIRNYQHESSTLYATECCSEGLRPQEGTTREGSSESGMANVSSFLHKLASSTYWFDGSRRIPYTISIFDDRAS
eukprot:scaffold8303_cov30-Tisochrysis_lutea.AAC.5